MHSLFKLLVCLLNVFTFQIFAGRPMQYGTLLWCRLFFPVTAGLPVSIKGLAACLPLPSDVTVLLIHSR